MFGHLRIQGCRLEDTDRSRYRSHFCSVCHNLHAFAGWDASLLTNYDITLWTLVAGALVPGVAERTPEQRPCTALPFRRVEVQPVPPEVGASLTALTVLLTWAKLQDHAQDGSRWTARLGQAWLASREGKARSYLEAKGYPLASLLQLPARQQQAEAASPTRLDRLSAPTREALRDAFGWIATLSQRPELEAALRELGDQIASFVYLWDALEDLPADDKAGGFNALRRVGGASLPTAVVRRELWGQLDAMEKAFNRLPLGASGKLCADLVATLRAKVRQHPLLQQTSSAPPGTRRRWREAGFLHASDCDCCDCGNCCDVNCCDSGCEGSNCCEISCCDCSPGDSCCEIDCCAGDCDCCCCCCSDRRRHGTGCRDFDCCFGGRHSESSGSRSSIGSDHLTALEPARAQLDCPACLQSMSRAPQLGRSAYRCSSCAAAWVDGQDGGRTAARGSIPPGATGNERTVSRGQRLCPHCRCLLRAPLDLSQPEHCEGCGGTLYAS